MSVLEGQSQWTQIQQQVNEAFNYTVVERHGGNSQRVIQLLLLLPHIRSIGSDVLHWLLRVKQERGPLLCDLLHEMIDANRNKIHRWVIDESSVSRRHLRHRPLFTVPTLSCPQKNAFIQTSRNVVSKNILYSSLRMRISYF